MPRALKNFNSSGGGLPWRLTSSEATRSRDGMRQVNQEARLYATRPAGQASPAYARHAGLLRWVAQIAQLTRPDRVHWCDGSESEYEALCADLVRAGTMIPLHAHKRPGSFAARSDPADVARVYGRTFICSAQPHDAGPTNNWVDPVQMKAQLTRLFDGCMRGRTLFVVPFSMGPLGAPLSKLGVQITDS